MWRDVHERFPVDRRRIYATGFSGGAVLAWWLAESTNAVAGVIGVGGRVNGVEKIGATSFDWFGITGDADFNFHETRLIEQKLEAANSSRRRETFEGGHRWAPKEWLGAAVRWMEVQAMRRGLRDRDEAIIARAFAADVELARNAADELQSLRTYRMVARSYEGLVDLEDVHAQIASLARSATVKRLEADERRATQLEASHRARMPGVIRRFINAEDVMTAPSLAHELRIGALQKLATEKTYEGAAARRVLETIHVQLAFYTASRVSGEKIAVIRAVAKMIRPE